MKKRLITVLSVLFALVLGLAVLSACGGGSENGDISVNMTELTLGVGDTRVLTATSKDGSNVTWTTSDKNVVDFISQVAQRGIATVQGKGMGKATLTATNASGKSATVSVTVEDFSIVISGDGLTDGKLTILRNEDKTFESKTLTAKILRSGQETDEKAVWTSSDESVLSVDNGVLTAHQLGTGITVTAKRSTGNTEATVTVDIVWKTAPNGWYEVLHGGESNSLGDNAGKWTWTGDEGWGGSTPTVKGDGYENGAVDLAVSGNTGWRWYGVQLFYKNAGLTAGQVYKLTFSVTSSAAGWITVNDTDVEIKVGKTDVTVYYIEGAGDKASVSINLATHDKMRNGVNPINQYPEGTLNFSALEWTPYSAQTLAAPTAFSVAQDKQLTITDTNSDEALEGYVIGFFKNADDAAPAYTQVVMKPVKDRDILEGRGGIPDVADAAGNRPENAGKMYLDDSFVPAGSYTLKVYAYSSSAVYQKSAWSAVSVAYTVSGSPDYKVLQSYRDVDRGVGRYYVWSEWDLFNLDKSFYKNNALTLTLTGESSWYSNQVYYEEAGMQNEHLYEYSFKMSAKDTENNDIPLTGKQFVINGTRIDAKTGENTYKVYFLYTGGLAVNMLLGKPTDDWQGTVENSGLPAGTYTFSDIKLTDMTAEGNDAMTFGDNVGTVTDKLVFWYAAIGDWAEWNATMAMRSMSYTANAASDTHYSYNFNYKVTPIDGKVCNWIFRMWYKNSANQSGTEYSVTLTLVSSEDGDIIINGETTHITAGEHEYKVYYTEEGYSLFLSMATETSMTGTSENGMDLTIKSVKWAAGSKQALADPTATLENGTVNITFPKDGVDHFEIGLYSGESLVSTQEIVSGGKIDDKQHMNGTYTVKLRACGDADHRDSGWVSLGTYTVTDGAPMASKLEQTDDQAKDHPGMWYHWLDHLDWEGSTATATKNLLDLGNKTFVFAYTTTGGPRLGYSVQLYFKNAGNQTGKLYRLTAKMTLNTNGTITVNGQSVALEKDVEKDINIVYTETANPSFSIQMGVYGAGAPVMNGEITIKNWNWEEVTQQKNLATPTNFAIDASGKISFTDPNTVGVKGYQIGFFSGDTIIQTIQVKNGDTLNTSTLFKGTYDIKVQALPVNAEYLPSGWSNAVSKTIETDPAYDMENVAEADAPYLTMVYWAETQNVTSARFENGTVTMTLSGPSNNWYSNQIFYKFNGGGDGYTFTMKIHSTAAGTIRVNGKDQPIVVGDNNITITNSMLGISLSMAPVDGAQIGAGTFTFSEFKWEKDGKSCGLDGIFKNI